MTLDTVWGNMMCKQLINTQFNYSILAGSFSPSYLGLVNIIIVFQGVWRVSGKCLGGVWEVSE